MTRSRRDCAISDVVEREGRREPKCVHAARNRQPRADGAEDHCADGLGNEGDLTPVALADDLLDLPADAVEVVAVVIEASGIVEPLGERHVPYVRAALL